MKNLLLAFLFCFSTIFLNAQSRQFIKEDFEGAKLLAHQQKKDLLFYYYTPTGMMDSKLENTVFTDKKLMDKILSQFVLFSMETRQFNRKKTFENYDLNLTPTFIFFDQYGNPLHQCHNISTAEELLKVSSEIRNPTIAYYLLKAQFEKDTTNNEVLYNYLISKSQTGIFDFILTDFDPLVHRYFENIPQHEIYSQKNWLLLNKMVSSVNDMLFDFIVENRNEFSKLYGEKVEELIQKIIFSSYSCSPTRFQQTGDISLYTKSKKLISNNETKEAKDLIEFIESLFSNMVEKE